MFGYQTLGSPKFLHDRYRDLSVPLPDGRVLFGIDVHEYRNHGLDNPEFSTSVGVSKGYDPLRKAVLKNCRKVATYKYQLERPATTGPAGLTNLALTAFGYSPVMESEIIDLVSMLRVYVGKGSPHEIAKALQLNVYFGLVKPDRSAIQKHCDDCIGLDCSGFSGAYYGGDYHGKGAKSYRSLGSAVTRLEDVKQGCAIVWLHTNHIAVVDGPASDSAPLTTQTDECDFMVAESTGSWMREDGPKDGLNYTQYTFKRTRNGFEVYRSTMKRKKLMANVANVTVRLLS